MKSKLPKYKISINPEYSENGESLGIDMIAFTSKPAILTKGMAFSAEQPKKQSFADDLKYRIAAPIMIPMEIYRCDDSEYYVEFTSEEIEMIHSKFMADMGKKAVFNLEHNANEVVPAYLLEAILIDSENKKEMVKKEYNVDVPLGTSFVVSQVTDKDYYNQLVENDQTGFSIEGFLGLALSEIINKHKQKEMKQKFEAVKTATGREVYIDGEVAVDSYVYCQLPSIMLIDGKRSETRYPIWDSIVELEDGTILSLDEGKILKVETKEASSPTEEVPAEAPVDETLSEENKEIIKEEKMNEEIKKDEVTEEVKANEVIEEVKDEAKEEVELAEGDVPAEAPADAPVETYTKAEVDAKFDEIYKMIADLKAEKVDDIVEDKIDEVTLSVHDRFAAFNRFSKNS